MSISPDVVIMTRAELEAVKHNSYLRGVRRGRFEQNHENIEANNPSEGPSKTKLPESPDSGGGPLLQCKGCGATYHPSMDCDDVVLGTNIKGHCPYCTGAT